MKAATALLAVLLFAGLAVSHHREVEVSCSPLGTLEVRGIPKRVGTVAEHPELGFVSATGMWRLVGEERHAVQLPRANSVEIVCDEPTRRCREAIAMLYSKEDAKRVRMDTVEGFLDVQTYEYEINEWSDTLIRAIARRPVADIEIQISLSNQTAFRSYRERADATIRPISNHYVLD